VGPLINVWEGVSVEDQATADERIPILLQTPASVRFVSYEPALGPIDFGPWVNPLASVRTLEPGVRWLDWVIVGGESGPGARSFDVEWARSAVRQCREARTACFVKQLGAKPITDHRTRPEGEPHYWTYNLGAKASDPSMWPEDLRIREFPQ
jgi:protein gp37